MHPSLGSLTVSSPFYRMCRKVVGIQAYTYDLAVAHRCTATDGGSDPCTNAPWSGLSPLARTRVMMMAEVEEIFVPCQIENTLSEQQSRNTVFFKA